MRDPNTGPPHTVHFMSDIQLVMTSEDGMLKRQQLSMFDSYFAQLLLRILKTTSTKLGRFYIPILPYPT